MNLIGGVALGRVGVAVGVVPCLWIMLAYVLSPASRTPSWLVWGLVPRHHICLGTSLVASNEGPVVPGGRNTGPGMPGDAGRGVAPTPPTFGLCRN